jgi:hypothetical protein
VIFGWREGARTERCILVDPNFPHPALHHGREMLRAWADHQDKLRSTTRTAGPVRMPWPCKTAVKEIGSAELVVWACDEFGRPRKWHFQDNGWRPHVRDLAERVASAIGCGVDVVWMGSDGVIERAVTPPGLAGRGFIGWGKGEKEPALAKADTEKMAAELDLEVAALRFHGKDLRILQQGVEKWR